MTQSLYVKTTSSASLEQRLIDGDESALREIYEQHGSMVLGICRNLVGGEAEDVAQQVFVAAWKNRARFDCAKGSLGAWLTGICRFKAIDHLRSKGRKPSVPSDEMERMVASEEASINQVVDRLVLRSAMEHLPPDRRTVIDLCFLQGMTHQQISIRLDMPLGTVKSHMRRGLAALQKELRGSRE